MLLTLFHMLRRLSYLKVTCGWLRNVDHLRKSLVSFSSVSLLAFLFHLDWKWNQSVHFWFYSLCFTLTLTLAEGSWFIFFHCMTFTLFPWKDSSEIFHKNLLCFLCIFWLSTFYKDIFKALKVTRWFKFLILPLYKTC